MLGITITNSHVQKNDDYNDCICKMENVSSTWFNRNLTISGKVLLINSLMSSIFIYRMYVLPPLSKPQLERIQKIIKSFLWKGKKPKIPTCILELPKEEGGLNLCNFGTRYDAIQASWVQKAISDNKYEYIYSTLAPILNKTIWQCNLRADHVQRCISDGLPAWKLVLKTWCNTKFFEPKTKEDILSQIIWLNSWITINKRPNPPSSKNS